MKKNILLLQKFPFEKMYFKSPLLLKNKESVLDMLKRNDEKINGFLFVIVLPLLLFAMSYYGFESSYTRLKTSETTLTFYFPRYMLTE